MIRDESINEGNAYSDLFLDSASLEKYIAVEKPADSIAAMMRNFYSRRNYQFAWFATNGLTEQARGFWSLYSETKDSASKEVDKDLRQKMDTLLEADTLAVNRTDTSFVHTELDLTKQLMQHASANPDEAINKRTVYELIPAKKLDVLELADSILNRQKDTSLYSGNTRYALMKQQLATCYSIAKDGGWGTIPSGSSNLKKGSRSPVITAIKKRLQATKEYSAADTTDAFNDSLVAAIKNYQSLNGFQPNGMVNDSLVAAMNIPVQEKIEQILVNMNRSLWMNPEKEDKRIEVNIPSFMLSAYEGRNKTFEMPVIVGKEGSGTVMFNGTINQIVFNPVWNIPASIVKNEIQPAMKSDPSYLRKHHMEVVSNTGGVPVIRQEAGKDNSLGRIKFLFPNSYDIYLHDTPDKTLFSRNDRALSHGCIRVADAKKLASYLLKDQPDWNDNKINTVLKTTSEEKVNVKNAEPVYISYYTAWVDDNGHMNFRNDIYGHDEEARNRLFKR